METYESLVTQRAHLWNSRIPEMVCHYFEDMRTILEGGFSVLKKGGYLVLAVGDSRYCGVHVNTSKILCEMAENIGFDIVRREAVRSMRASAQQGGRFLLKESLVWLRT